MSKSKITIIGFENYLNNTNRSLFDNIILHPDIEKDILIDAIMMRCSEFELLYSNPLTMIEMITFWFRKHNRTFSKWMEALSIEYNPLENYDRMEDWTDDNIGHGSVTVNDTVTSHLTNSRSAFDSNTFVSDTKSDNTTIDKGTTTSNGNNNLTHHGRLHGNIGVTTSQQMLEAELEIARWNIYDKIADLFAMDFCLMVY